MISNLGATALRDDDSWIWGKDTALDQENMENAYLRSWKGYRPGIYNCIDEKVVFSMGLAPAPWRAGSGEDYGQTLAVKAIEKGIDCTKCFSSGNYWQIKDTPRCPLKNPANRSVGGQVGRTFSREIWWQAAII